MATISISNRFAKGFENKTSGTKMVWWKTNFNMPVPNIFDDNTIFTKTEGELDGLGVATTFDLSGFNQGWEVLAAATMFVIDGSILAGTTVVEQIWKDTNGDEIFTNSFTWNYNSQVDGVWQGRNSISNQGVAPWEIFGSGTYTLEAKMTGDVNFSETFPVEFTNAPTFTGYQTPGYTWVEGDNLRYVSANGFVHTLSGNNIGAVGGNPGNIRINSVDNWLEYIDSSGNKRTTDWEIEQFASIFSNGAPGPVSGETPGYLYADSEFGWTHLSYIGSDGKKYLIGDGHYPYVNPY